MSQKLVPPFNEETARAKVKAAQDGWNSCDPERVARAYSLTSDWRNREDFFVGREAIEAFLTRKWQKEKHYRLMKELWAYTDNRISVRFEYEWQHADTGQWPIPRRTRRRINPEKLQFTVTDRITIK